MEKKLVATAISTFEELGYLLPDPSFDTAKERVPIRRWMRVRFRGVWNGELQLGMSAASLGEIAANMLGSETAVDADQQLDALGEVANVLCGNLLPAIAGTASEFAIEAPQALSESWPADGENRQRLLARAEIGLEMTGRAEVLLLGEESARKLQEIR